MSYEDYARIKQMNEAAVQPDSGYTKLCAEIENLIGLYEGARDERDAAILQVDALRETLTWLHKQHLASIIHGPCSICMAIEKAQKDSFNAELDRRTAEKREKGS